MDLKDIIAQAVGLQPELRRLLIAIVDSAGSGGPVTVAWGDITGKPTAYAPQIGTTATTAAAGNHTHAVAAITGLQTALDAKPNKAAAQANSTATDIAGLVTDFNALLAKLRTAGIITN